MSQMFYPKSSVRVQASAPHPEGTEYKVSIGEEDWDGIYKTVIKVQMIYNGKIAGRKSPSYPLNSDDAERVTNAIRELKEQYNAENEVRVIHYSEIKPTYVPVEEYVELICRIPDGFVTTWDDLNRYFKDLYHAERVDVEPNSHWPLKAKGSEIPYWRIVGNTGFLINDMRVGTVEIQERKLIENGLPIEPCGRGMQSRRVKNYKNYFYDLSKINKNGVLSVEKPEDAYREILLNSENYRAFATDMLRSLVENLSCGKQTEATAKSIEYAKNELKRRGDK